MFYIPMSAYRAYFYLFCPEEERSITENALVVKASYILRVIFSTQNIPFKRIVLWLVDHDSSGYLTESIASYTDTILHQLTLNNRICRPQDGRRVTTKFILKDRERGSNMRLLETKKRGYRFPPTSY